MSESAKNDGSGQEKESSEEVKESGKKREMCKVETINIEDLLNEYEQKGEVK